jgi:hypothetical protein
MKTKHLFVDKKSLTAIFVFFFSIFGIQSSYADYYPSGIQQNVSEQTLIDNGWTKFYEQTYGTITATTAPLRPSEQYVILAGKAVGSSTIILAAAAPTSAVFTETVLNTPQLINGTYWYNTPSNSIGFAPTATISQNTADQVDTSSVLRLSWHLNNIEGGWRLGSLTELNSSTAYLKQVWTWNGVSTTPAPAPVYVRQTSNLTFAQSLYASDTLSDEDGELRKTVDQIMAKYGSLIK